jgi:hypothetical protein
MQNGTRTESYYHDGKLHREYGPAIVEANADGSWSEDYYRDGELHRADGPAIIEVRAENGARTESYYRGGESVMAVGAPLARRLVILDGSVGSGTSSAESC